MASAISLINSNDVIGLEIGQKIGGLCGWYAEVQISFIIYLRILVRCLADSNRCTPFLHYFVLSQIFAIPTNWWLGTATPEPLCRKHGSKGWL